MSVYTRIGCGQVAYSVIIFPPIVCLSVCLYVCVRACAYAFGSGSVEVCEGDENTGEWNQSHTLQFTRSQFPGN